MRKLTLAMSGGLLLCAPAAWAVKIFTAPVAPLRAIEAVQDFRSPSPLPAAQKPPSPPPSIEKPAARSAGAQDLVERMQAGGHFAPPAANLPLEQAAHHEGAPFDQAPPAPVAHMVPVGHHNTYQTVVNNNQTVTVNNTNVVNNTTVNQQTTNNINLTVNFNFNVSLGPLEYSRLSHWRAIPHIFEIKLVKIGQMIFAYVLQESLVGLRPWGADDRHLLWGLFDGLMRSRVEIVDIHDLDALRRGFWIGHSPSQGWGAYCMNSNLLAPSLKTPVQLATYYTGLLERLLP